MNPYDLFQLSVAAWAFGWPLGGVVLVLLGTVAIICFVELAVRPWLWAASRD
jgi:hypothetical protein